jgi:hypothetical protein
MYFDRMFKDDHNIGFESEFVAPTKDMYHYDGKLTLKKPRVVD